MSTERLPAPRSFRSPRYPHGADVRRRPDWPLRLGGLVGQLPPDVLRRWVSAASFGPAAQTGPRPPRWGVPWALSPGLTLSWSLGCQRPSRRVQNCGTSYTCRKERTLPFLCAYDVRAPSKVLCVHYSPNPSRMVRLGWPWASERLNWHVGEVSRESKSASATFFLLFIPLWQMSLLCPLVPMAWGSWQVSLFTSVIYRPRCWELCRPSTAVYEPLTILITCPPVTRSIIHGPSHPCKSSVTFKAIMHFLAMTDLCSKNNHGNYSNINNHYYYL